MRWLRVRSLTVSPGYEPGVGTLYYPALAIIALLAGCASNPAVPTVVRVPVPVTCLRADQVPAAPAVRSEAEILAMTDYAATIAIWAERLELRAYAERASALLNGCGGRRD